MVLASTEGVIDYATDDGSERWRRAARLKLQVLERKLAAQSSHLSVMRAIVMQNNTRVEADAGELQDTAIKRIQDFRQLTMPWLHAGGTGMVGQDLRDSMLLWYATYAPHILERARSDRRGNT